MEDQEDEEGGGLQLPVTRLYNGDINSSNSRSLRCSRARICGGVVLFFFAVVVGFGIYLKDGGYFDKIKRDVIIDGDDAIEPNTGLRYPLVIEDHGAGSHGEKLRLIGLFLKDEMVVSIKLKVFVLALYVDWEIAKKVLKRWKGVSDPASDPELVATIADGVTIPGTLKYRMMMTIPGSRMFDAWFGDIEEILAKENVAPEEKKEVDTAFHHWLGRPLHNKDYFDFDWRFANGFLDSSEKGDVQEMSCVFNGKLVPPVEKSRELIHAIVLHEIEENGSLVMNLLDLLWQDSSTQPQGKGLPLAFA